MFLNRTEYRLICTVENIFQRKIKGIELMKTLPLNLTFTGEIKVSCLVYFNFSLL
jgi:hypothetical protein